MSARTACRIGLLALALPLACATAVATESGPAGPGHDEATIGPAVGRDMHGRIAINEAAGSGNAQANLAAIALAARGVGQVGLQARQQPATGDRNRAAHAQIGAGAFAGTRGVFSLNQVAGSGNGQVNLFAVGELPSGALAAADITGLDDSALAAVAGDPVSAGSGAPAPVRQARIADGAFHGSQGVVQVNQTAGVGNLSTNAIVLQLPGGTP